jgi:membrane-associated phospholipid phosphatase
MFTAMMQVAALSATLLQRNDSMFWRSRDTKVAIVGAIATLAIAPFDERIARWARSGSVQGDSSRHNAVKSATVINEVPLTLAAVTTYVVGRVSHNATVTDVGAHLTESLVATVVVEEVARIALGRARPHESPDDAFKFKPFLGLSRFEYRSFPSLHAAVAFATAATLGEEMRQRDASSRKWLTPALYVAASIPGFTRVYLDQHWASDVVSGSVVGALLGAGIVRHSHGHHTFVDRLLIPNVSVANDHVSFGWTFVQSPTGHSAK